ncbi:MAG TPA: penicillin acylase family protein [Opitutaceae bacterium]|nr:penicillin acylase family protein [Opitutaceae bacterium]
MKPAVVQRLRLLASCLSVLLLVAVLFVGWMYWRLRASLPQLDGRAAIATLAGEVRVQRDALGVPTVQTQNRADAARAVGWLHAQDRCFQMDLFRRSAAGELAELFGKRLIARDQLIRRHGFRKIAEQVVAQLPAPERAIVDAYVEGVNAALSTQREKPFEYIVLRDRMRPWSAADSVLVIFAMTIDLQDENGRYEQTLLTLRDQLGPEALAFFSPLVSPNDAALDGSTAPLPPIPGPKLIDLRQAKPAAPAGTGKKRNVTDGAAPSGNRDRETYPGSNAFALSGAHTASGAGLLANDMHLDHGVPNTWYRVSLDVGGRKVTGVTLPGTPAIVAGSNGDVAWGFTNSYTDTIDLVVVEVPPAQPGWYIAPGHPDGLPLEHRKETIHVKGGEDVHVEVPWTIWGPVIARNERQQPLALRWVSHDPAATNFALLAMEDARNVADAVAVAHRAGIPPQNLVVADRSGDIAWTIAGRLPRRVGFDGRLPVSWRFGDRKWDGMIDPTEIPVVTTKPSTNAAEAALPGGRIWSGNQRHLGGAALALLGDGEYARPARAAQIRDDLAPIERATPRDLLAVQLDNRALFLTPWHRLLMDTLTPEVTAQKKARAGLRSFAQKWEGHAALDAISYPLVRDFRLAVNARIYPAIFAACLQEFPRFAWTSLHFEPATWALLREKPAHLLDPQFATWEDLLVAAADDVITQVDKRARLLPQATWGWHNTARIRHPFGNLMPAWASDWLNMAPDPLPGGSDMPRVQSPGHGASERMVVSPGREAEGIFHMPCGQSAHPLSPYYRAGHEAWVNGQATPFLPGKTEHTLVLAPR